MYFAAQVGFAVEDDDTAVLSLHRDGLRSGLRYAGSFYTKRTATYCTVLPRCVPGVFRDGDGSPPTLYYPHDNVNVLRCICVHLPRRWLWPSVWKALDGATPSPCLCHRPLETTTVEVPSRERKRDVTLRAPKRERLIQHLTGMPSHRRSFGESTSARGR